MSLPPIPPWQEVLARLPVIFPAGTPNRDHSIWEIAAKTIHVMLYAGAVEGRDYWLRPDQVSRMTDRQAAQTGDSDRLAWAKASLKPGKGEIPGRWYAVNTRESIRDDTIRYSLIQNGAVIERGGLATTSPAGRYALQADFAGLFDPAFDEATFRAKADVWREKHLNSGALARIALNRRGAVDTGDRVLVAFPNGETRALSPGVSTDIVKAVVEVFAVKFLTNPGVISISESSNKVVARDEQLAKAIGLDIAMDKHLPDVVLVDLGPKHPLLVFVEVVATDGPINDLRKGALLELAGNAGFKSQHVAFVTAYLDRSVQPFKRTVDSLAWGTYAWFASEPDNLVVFASAHGPLGT
ncbi:BsuBI/PstI family type II restriction endonuclease [uncultured Brevundimonas sp.]|uniref:BsuBI/PstI family type II restriction endonuclease n=1 Tax=uncultured Brevundimonas sp. TaxID=213418 RepID=UPI0026081959|nr:BsuBI/PstI family type II restriction endonuclease [uncultured Brevundimonas sp.]